MFIHFLHQGNYAAPELAALQYNRGCIWRAKDTLISLAWIMTNTPESLMESFNFHQGGGEERGPHRCGDGKDKYPEDTTDIVV